MISADADLAVVGAGACGTMAALRAAEAGLDVVVLEKDAARGGNTELSSAVMQACATRFQRAAGIDDSAQRMAHDILEKNHHQSDPEVTLALCEASHEYVEWINDVLGYELELTTEIRRAGQSVPRVHTDVNRHGGRGLIRVLRAAANDHPRITFVDRFPGQGLIVEDGEVRGVFGGDPHNAEPLRARKVLLACGGFGANPEMVGRYCPEAQNLLYIGAETVTGEGIVWGQEAGAALAHMSAYQGHGYTVVDYGTYVNPGIPLEGGMIVNVHGERFAREDVGYSEFASVIATQPHKHAIIIFDERILALTRGMDIMIESLEVGAIKALKDVDALADHFGLDRATLHATFASFEEATKRGSDEFGRTRFGIAPLTGPFYAAKLTGGFAHTQGGLKVDRFARVLRPNCEAIKNLFAGGGTAAGVSGDGTSGYLSGNGLLSALGFGTIAARRIATDLGASVTKAGPAR